VGDKVTDKDYFIAGLSIVLGQKNAELQGKFNAALYKIKHDGTYAALYKMVRALIRRDE
jgi:arginine transport system substrate-binding protein